MNFNQLIDEIAAGFEDEVLDLDRIKALLSLYKSKPEEWKKYAIFDELQCCYTRNLVHRGNGKFNALILCWGPGACSNVHDHPNSQCFVKVLSGDLMETRFHFPQDGADKRLAPLDIIDQTTCKKDEVSHIDDSIGVHRMENPSHSEPAVSLHIYCPPYQECKLYDQRTSQTHVGKVTFWSEYGVLTKNRGNLSA
ncbi:hypothetical protein PRIPAC_86608 [Pristionchus pacificus]|uniref:Cysteine dioxygenase n=1 Tax=Pristionchus pacificus TaxID=54126 RepID=A0A2A6BKV0_PRIPA|nr:hypothetical protein PRIPAC_86608 [Pristionchus pacificus]|eukprot:PDM66529.1 hypothetical protein PRIPAC_47946 [Pristionchus pacificus]